MKQHSMEAPGLVTAEDNERFWADLLEPNDTAPFGVSATACDESAAKDLTFEEAVAKLQDIVTASPRHREIYLSLLEFCVERRSLEEAEAFVAGLPEFSCAAQPPYRLVRTMVDAGGLAWIELSEDGNVVLTEDKAGLSEDEVDDLIVSFAVETTPVGEQVRDELSPERRMRKLFDEVPSRLGAYRNVMEFCCEPRTYQEVHDLLSSAPSVAGVDGKPLQPSFFLDTLERAGGLKWDNGWKVTKRGAELLSRMG